LIDGLLVFILLWLYARKQRPRLAVAAMFTLLYGCARIFTEHFRMPDWETSFAGISLSSGQVLSLPMVAAALAMFWWAYRGQAKPVR
jgi:phosphatidylglycerol:prolipoprotein diacylglycerol transferase